MAYQKRIVSIYLSFLLVIALLTARLYVLASGNRAEEMLSGQYTRKYDIASFRGFLYDRNLDPLEGQEAGFTAFVNPAKVKASPGYASSQLSEYADTLSETELYQSIKTGVPFRFLTTDDLQNEWVKSFPLYERGKGTTARHIIGYINNDGTGVAGLEKVYDKLLNGTLSGKVYARYEADAGKTALEGAEPVIYDEGYSQKNGIVLTLDKDLQQKAEEIADRTVGSGAIVVSDITTGEILTALSRPVYDPEHLSDYLTSESGVFLNRALCAFTPGSLFKIVVAAAALESDQSLEYMRYTCTGRINVSGEIIGCHKTDGHGLMDMKSAFANSCNTYFITLAQKVGYLKIIEMAKRLGVSEPLELDGLAVQIGHLPDDKVIPPALLANTAIGQGSLLVTPLEAIKLISAAVTGKIVDPSIVNSVYEDGEVHSQPHKEAIQVLDDSITVKLREMLFICVEEGTGIHAKPQYGIAGGKTATAQTGQFKDTVEMTNLWFAGAYPLDNPKYAIVVLCDANAAVSGPRSHLEAFRELCDYLATRSE